MLSSLAGLLLVLAAAEPVPTLAVGTGSWGLGRTDAASVAARTRGP